MEIVDSPDVLRQNRIPPGQRLRQDWPVLHHGPVPSINTDKWQFSIFGLVSQEKRLSYGEFEKLPRVKVRSDIHCVTGWSKLDNLWEGPSSRTIYELSPTLQEAKYLMVRGANDFTTNLSLADFLEDDVLFALKYNDKPLPREHGYPVRLIVPRLYFWKSAKWVSGIEYLRADKPGFWESRGYHNHGDPWQEERYS